MGIRLIEHNIFPAILWPDQFKKNDKQLEKTLLFVHTDFRYNSDDISEITHQIKEFVNE